jgi:creatinine amidohydrolase
MASRSEPAGSSDHGWLLADLTWRQAQTELSPERVVVIPLGAGAKEHGPHLRLDNDLVLAEYLGHRVLQAAPVIVTPTVNYSYYPAFLEYPGSTSLDRETARDLVVQICRTLAAHGPRRFYILNTGLSTIGPLKDAAAILASDSILMRFTGLDVLLGSEKVVKLQQPFGSHADEYETSVMLYIAPDRVDMTKAVPDVHKPRGPGPLTPDSTKTSGVYSPSGSWGDPTFATKEKGRTITEALVAALLHDIDSLRTASVPSSRVP